MKKLTQGKDGSWSTKCQRTHTMKQDDIVSIIAANARRYGDKVPTSKRAVDAVVHDFIDAAVQSYFIEA